MKYRYGYVKRLLLILSILFFSHSLLANQIQFDKKKLELAELSKQIHILQITLENERKQNVALDQQLKTTELTLSVLNQEINHITQLQLAQKQELEKLKNQQQQETDKLNMQLAALALHVRKAYELGKLNEFKIILNQENPQTLSRYLGYYRYLTQQRLQLINESKATLDALNHTMQEITQNQFEMKNLLLQKQQQQQKQESTQKLRQALIVGLAQEVQTKEQQLTTLLTNQKALQDTLLAIQRQPVVDILSNYLPFEKLQGKLRWPVNGNIIGYFGNSLQLGDQHLTGMIIKAPQGTPVHAISAGKIVFANWLRGFGLLVIIDHGNGYMSLYGRNQTVFTKVGNKVKSGELIAAIGNTGGYDISSLYFEIRRNGMPVNPSLWCRST